MRTRTQQIMPLIALAASLALTNPVNAIGPECNCPADLDGDCAVGPADLAILLGNWG